MNNFLLVTILKNGIGMNIEIFILFFKEFMGINFGVAFRWVRTKKNRLGYLIFRSYFMLKIIQLSQLGEAYIQVY